MHLPRRLIRQLGAVRRPATHRGHRARPFDLFTDRARDAVALAQDEARRLGHDSIGTEHLLLGILRQRNGVAARMLAGMGVRLADVRVAVESIVGRGSATVAGEMRLTPRTKRALELAVREAERLRHRYLGTEHLLLGIAGEREGVAAEILDGFGVNHERVRADVLRLVGPGPDGA